MNPLHNSPENIPLRQFYDKLDEKYGHDNDKGQLFNRKTKRPIVIKSLRSQIRGHRQSIPATAFAYWLKTGEIPDRAIVPRDGNRANLRFDNLERYKNVEERFEERKLLWLSWCHSSPEEREIWLKTKPEPQPPRWGL